MRKIYTTLSILALIFVSVQGQINYKVELIHFDQQSYTDLGSNGSAITTSNFDNATSAALPIGFNFSFNGNQMSHFMLNTNGFIKLGASSGMTGLSHDSLAYTYFNDARFGGVLNSTSTNDVQILSPFNHDLTSSGTAQTEYRYHTSGTSPNRVCTIQWKNVTDKNITDSNNSPLPHVQFTSMNFQIKLFERDSVIEYIYGPFTATNDTSLFKLAGCGIKGTSVSPTQMVTVFKGSTTPWKDAAFQAGNYTAGGLNFGNSNAATVPTGSAVRPHPVPGATYRFVPQNHNDAAIELIYTQHAQNIPWNMPEDIVIRVSNVGTATMTGVKVYLQVSGANTYLDSTTYNSLSAGSQSNATFSGYQPENTGIDTISVIVSRDSNRYNNVYEQIQIVSHHDLGIGDSSGTLTNFGFGGGGIFCTKYRMHGKRRIGKAKIKIGTSTTAVGQSVYAAIIDQAGDIVGRSDNLAITANDLDQYHTFEIYSGGPSGPKQPPPLITNNRDYYVGLAQPSGGYFPLSLQGEEPNRVGRYYTHALGNSSTFSDISNNFNWFRYTINAYLVGTSLEIVDVTGLSDPSCADSNITIEVTIHNKDSIAADFSVDTLPLIVSSTGAINQSYTNFITSGVLLPDSTATFTITNDFDLNVAGKYDIKVSARTWIEVDTASSYEFFEVNVVDTPAVDLTVLPGNSLCFGTPYVFTATPYTAGSILYQWKVNGQNVGAPTSDSSFSGALVYGDTVSVDLITDHCTTGTFVIPSNEIEMLINPSPKDINNIQDVDTVIENTSKNYALPFITTSNFLWTVSGGTLSDTTGNAVTVNWGGVNTNAKITCTETDQSGCTYTNELDVVIISIVGLEEEGGLYLGRAYPNPANTILNIPLHTSNEWDIELSLFDVTGKLVKSIHSGLIGQDQIFEVEVDDLQNGLYFYKLITADGYESIQKVTIQH